MVSDLSNNGVNILFSKQYAHACSEVTVQETVLLKSHHGKAWLELAGAYVKKDKIKIELFG